MKSRKVINIDKSESRKKSKNSDGQGLSKGRENNMYACVGESYMCVKFITISIERKGSLNNAVDRL